MTDSIPEEFTKVMGDFLSDLSLILDIKSQENKQEQANQDGRLEVLEKKRTFVILDIEDEDGEIIELYHTVNVPEHKRRYTIEDQQNDYIDHVLNKTLPEERNDELINKINKITEE